MDFFAAQERARQRTTRLVVMFGLAVAGTIVACYAVAAWIWAARSGAGPAQWWDLALFSKVTGGVLLVVAAAAWFKWRQYAEGGAAIAERAGGRRVSATTTRTEERRLLNVAEEMAIASGVPVPAVFVLDGEDGINAFAAGLSPADAAVAVTQGALERLTRDEMQGVVGHEFSHILNGDMRLNLRLGALVFGILAIGLTGRAILWSLRSVRLRGKNNGGFILLAVAAGVTLLVIGYIGYFFGRLAQAAISRQREFLADASAVQFTRNPDGIASALRRIAGDATGSRLHSAEAEALGHFLFAQGFRSWFGGLWATHPDIRERIRAIVPNSDAQMIGKKPVGAENREVTATASLSAAACLGSLSGPQVRQASALIAIIPAPLRDAARDSAGAAAILAGLGLSTEADTRTRQYLLLEDYREQLVPLDPALRKLRPALRLPLAQLALASMKGADLQTRRRLLQTLERLTSSDAGLSLFEFTLIAMTRRELGADPNIESERSNKGTGEVAKDVAVVLSALAVAGTQDERQAAESFGRGAEQVPLPVEWLKFVAVTDFSQLGLALKRIAGCHLTLRQQVLRAGAAIIDADSMRTPDEIELLRVVAAAIGCPMSLPV